MSGQMVVHVALGPANVTVACDDIGYSPDVMDDMRVRAVDSLHDVLHMRTCGSEATLEDLMARFTEDGDGGD